MDEAHDLVRRVAGASRGITSSYQKGLVFEALERSLDDITSREVLLYIAAAALEEQSATAASVARRLAELNYKSESADLLQKLAAQPAEDYATNDAAQFVCACTLMRLDRSDDATRAMLDALDIGRTSGSWAHGSLYKNLAETLVDLGHAEALRSMHQTLVTTPKWWDASAAP